MKYTIRCRIAIVSIVWWLTPLVPSVLAQQTAEQLHALLDDAWAFELREDPLFATSVGEHGYNDRLPSVAPDDQRRRADLRRRFLQRLHGIDIETLQEQDRISYRMFERQLTDALREFEFRTFEIPILVDDGFHISYARLPNDVPLQSLSDYESYLARLRAFPAYVDQHIANMRAGLSRGFTLPQVVLEGYDVTIAAHVVDDPAESVFFEPFREFPTGIPTERHAGLVHQGNSAILESVVPGYRRFLEFMTTEYIPGARRTIGASEWPDGRAYYDYLIRHFTTLDLSADDIHALGESEVRRIRQEMESIIREVGFDGDFAAFLQFLRSDPRFYVETPEALLKQAAYIAKRMDGKLPSLFKTLPRLPYGVEPVPSHLAPKYTGGRYVSAPVGGTKPGSYWVNTYALDSRPLYTLTALTLHEAVPGHHLQFALAQEQENLPAFRRFAYVNAFGEGWGLYAEWLGVEAGMYTDPYARFGRLTYEMWRACRLVVDTGLHARGWTRQQAMDFLASNTALSLHEVRTETDRYISWPGQALAYKIGELKIKELRRYAESALGDLFDVRAFHDVVLLNGTVPLDVLQEQVQRYVATVSVVR